MAGRETVGGTPGARRPQVWGQIPPRNRNFTGREELLARLREGIAGKVTAVVPQPHALHGLGGVGKTQMAVEYVHRYQYDYDLIWWVPSDQPVLVKTTLAELAPFLGLPSAAVSGIDDATRDVLDALRRGEPYAKWLLVFDNADQPEDLFDIIPQDVGHVLITSRNHRWASQVETVPVDVFRRDESIEFLSKRVRDAISVQDADLLAEELGDLPLALEQAGALLFERGMTAAEYLQQLSERTSQLLSQGRPVEYPVPMTAAWSLSVTNLSETFPEAVDLLQLCAFFGSEPIPRDVFGQAPEGLSPNLSELFSDPIRLGRAVGELGRYALARLDVTNRTVHVHRLVQRLVQDELSIDEQRRIRHEAHLLLAAFEAGDPDDSANWPRYGSLLGHVTPSLVAECSDAKVRAFAVNVLRYLFRSGDYRSAQSVATDFTERWSRDSGPEHADVIRAQLEHANILRELGEYEAATELNQQVLATAERVLGLEHDISLWSLRGSAADMRAAGDFRAALQRDAEALRRCEERYGEHHGSTLRAVNNLAINHGLLSDYERAKELHQRAYAGWRRPESRLVQASMINALNGLARALRLSGEFSESFDIGEDAYALGQQMLGADHNWTMRTGRDQSITLRRLGELEEAEELVLQIHDRCVRILGLKHPDTLGTAITLSNVMRARGRLDEAFRLVGDTAAKYPDVFGDEHPFTQGCRTDLAVLYRVRGNPEEARRLNERALETLERKLGRDHDYTLTAALNLASDLAALGELDAACKLGADSHSRLLALFGDRHPLTLTAAANLSADLTASGMPEEAEPLIERTRETYRRGPGLGLDHPDAKVFLEGRHLDADFDPPPV
ncbi:FxSxx-COOH system tetratricopeptide repeat protein [Spirillospora sp. NPDC047279]|uniref:FxSxx-COOH system tetratricopeptide repeat protein n=1 Tax=Spirillospora sp. NPDC047279 TaxID=3155478 RepID=UPI0033C1571D